MDDLVEYWKKLEITSEELIHPCDVELLEKNKKINCNFEGYISKVENLFDESSQLHTGLIPIPYAGDLKNASIYLLMINPGFSPNDYFSEYNCKEYKGDLINSLKQNNLDENYPFISLNPKYCHTSGGQYWLKKFGSIIRKLKNEKGLDYEEAIKLIAMNICVLELFPYHSKNFNISNKIIRDLESTKRIKKFVSNLLSSNRDVIIECLRRPDDWGLKNNESNEKLNILLPKQRQSASLNVEKEVGERVYNKLCELNKNKVVVQ